MNRKCLISGAALLCAAVWQPSALAQGSVSLDSCRRMALSNNKTIRMAEETISGAGYDRKAAKAAYLPGIDFTAAYAYNQHGISLLSEDAMLPTKSFNPGTGSFEWNILTDPLGNPIKNPDGGGYIPTEVAVIPKEALSFDTHNVFGAAVTLTQPVFMGGEIKALNDIARYAEKAAVAARNTVVQHYDVEAMLDAGVATRSDLLTVDVKLNEAKIMLTKVENGLTLSRMALAQICGQPVSAAMTLADEDSGMSGSTGAPAYTYNMQDVLARRQDLEAVRQGVNVLESRERMVMGTMLPKVGIVGSYSFSTPNLIDGFSKRVRGGFSVGAGVTIPIWHWGGKYNHYRAAKTATNAQRLLLEDLEEKVELQVEQAKFKFQEAFKTLDMARSNMKSAEENLRNAEIGFHEGVLTANDVILAQTGWLQANSERIDAEIGVRLCEVYLSKVLGTLGYERTADSAQTSTR